MPFNYYKSINIYYILILITLLLFLVIQTMQIQQQEGLHPKEAKKFVNSDAYSMVGLLTLS